MQSRIMTRSIPSVTLFPIGILLLISLWIYWPVQNFDYLAIDDTMHTEDNPQISPFTLENVSSFWRQPYENAYTPITYTFWALLAHLGRNSESELLLTKSRMNPKGNRFKPGVFHLGNLVVHCSAVIAVFFLLKLLFSAPLPVFIGSLLFAVHPLQVETVCWITGLRDVLSGLFSILSIYFYLKSIPMTAANIGVNRGSFERIFYYGGALFFFVGVLCKSSALMVPFIAFLFAYFYFHRKLGRILLDFGPWFLFIVPIMKIFFGLNDSVALKVVHQTTFPERLLLAGDAITFYIQKFLLPITLTMDYGRTPQYVLGLPERFLTGFFPVILIVGGLLFFFLRKGVSPLVCTGIFILGLGPVLGITPFIFQHISTTADRYVYLSLLGPCVGLTVLFRSSGFEYLKGFVSVILFLFALKSSSQVGVWRNNLTLFSQTLEHTPQSWLASNDLGTVFEGMGQFDTAMSLYERSADIANIPSAWNNAGAMAIELKDYSRAQSFFKLAIESSKGASWAHHNLGAAYMMASDKAKAMEQYEIVASRSSRYKNAHKHPRILRKDDGRTADPNPD